MTFSRAQQELIEDLLDEARAADAGLDAVFELIAAGGMAVTEPVIVKNLETVQGDERDVVLLSVGYGPDATGAFSMNFGPLSRRGGERRLNVAITRAREQLVIFSSFAPEDLAEGVAGPARDLAELLAFARAGGGAARPADDAAPASPITAAIARALAERGWTVRHQVGCGAYKVDLAVVDPNDPERYVLAIEHDGAAYASAPAARDRDRLRAQVLAQLGWRLHRIWSLDWWADPEREIQRAHGAIVTAVAASRQRRTSIAPATSPRPRPAAPASRPRLAGGSAPVAAAAGKPRVAAGSAPVAAAASKPAIAAGSGPMRPALDGPSAPLRIARGAIAIGPYTVAAIPAGRRVARRPVRAAPPRRSSARSSSRCSPPRRRCTSTCSRAGSARTSASAGSPSASPIRSASRSPGAAGGATSRTSSGASTRIRPACRRCASPAHGPSARREIDEVPLSEVAAAARIVVERAVGHRPAATCVRDTARLLGFARITERVTERVASGRPARAAPRAHPRRRRPRDPAARVTAAPAAGITARSGWRLAFAIMARSTCRRTRLQYRTFDLRRRRTGMPRRVFYER